MHSTIERDHSAGGTVRAVSTIDDDVTKGVTVIRLMSGWKTCGICKASRSMYVRSVWRFAVRAVADPLGIQTSSHHTPNISGLHARRDTDLREADFNYLEACMS